MLQGSSKQMMTYYVRIIDFSLSPINITINIAINEIKVSDILLKYIILINQNNGF